VPREGAHPYRLDANIFYDSRWNVKRNLGADWSVQCGASILLCPLNIGIGRRGRNRTCNRRIRNPFRTTARSGTGWHGVAVSSVCESPLWTRTAQGGTEL
jgi:hypothetical protein